MLRLLRPQRLVISFAWVAVAATFLLLPARSPYVIGLLGAVVFLLVPALNALAFSLVLEQAPRPPAGRVTTAAIQIASLAAPVGPLLAGVLVGSAGTSAAIVVYGSAFVVLALLAGTSALRE